MDYLLDQTKKIINNKIKWHNICDFGYKFSDVCKLYPFSNENLRECFNLVNLKNYTSALTVLASGDQLFNLLVKGLNNIDTFDINLLTEYYVFGIKKAMILKYDLENFKDNVKIFFRSYDYRIDIDEITNFILDLLPYMEEKYQNFWLEIAEYNYKIQKKNKYSFNIFTALFRPCSSYGLMLNNEYVENDINYNILKSKLNASNINFKCMDAINIDKNFKKSYDVIFMSNVLDYFKQHWNKNEYKEKLIEYKNMLLDKTNINGTLFLKYVFYEYSKVAFNKSKITLDSIDFAEIESLNRLDYCDEGKDNILLIKK